MVTAKISGRPGVVATIRETSPAVRYLLVGVMVNQLGAFVHPFLLLYLMHRGFAVGQAGVALTIYSVGAIVGTVVGGELTHRIGARATIVGAMTGSALMLALIPLVSGDGLSAPLACAVAFAGLAAQCYRPAAAIMLNELMPDEYRLMAFSMLRIALNTGAALGPLIAGVVILVDWNLLFWIDALTASMCGLLALLRLPYIRAARHIEDAASQQESAYRLLLRDRGYRMFLLATLVGAVIWVQYLVALPLTIAAAGYSPAFYSAVLMIGSGVLVVTELKITSYVKLWQPNIAGAVGTAILGLGFTGFLLAGYGFALIVACTVVLVFGMMIQGPTMFAHPATFPAAVKARYVGAHQAIHGVGLALGPLLGVAGWEAIGQGIWPLCGLLGLVAAWCAYIGMRTD
ncbi:MFS transporter [Nocardia vinacea]|uniref:MFS transporter n=1 Tax=Nocardia vinacea TaxID=96468 RepID=A0ABZ1YXG0_9NOCA|nr:MFS transporter [Nocardia vinacea]